jgi:hypothetical protein
MPEVAVRIEEDEAIAAASPQSQGVSQKNTAISAENDDKSALIEERADTVRQVNGVSRDGLRVAISITELPGCAISRRHDCTGIVGA